LRSLNKLYKHPNCTTVARSVFSTGAAEGVKTRPGHLRHRTTNNHPQTPDSVLIKRLLNAGILRKLMIAADMTMAITKLSDSENACRFCSDKCGLLTIAFS